MVELPTHLRGASMGETMISRAELAGHQRDRVVAKATPIFAGRGYQATTVDDLLASAKVGVGNFYSLFEGKEDCFLACLDRSLAEVQGRIDAAVAGAPDWDSCAYLGLAAAVDFVTSESAGATLVLVEAQSAGAVATARYNLTLDRMVAWLASGRGAHPEAGGLPPSFEEASIPGLAFYLQRCLVERELPSAPELLAESAGLLLEPMVGAERLAALARTLPGVAAV